MRDRLIASVKRDLVLDAHVRYGLARNVPARDDTGRSVKLCLAVIERDNGPFEVAAINEERIRFHGEQIIAEEVLKRAYA